METINDLQYRCFRECLDLEEQDLSELLEALNADHSGEEDGNNSLHHLIQRNMEHFQEYITKRIELAMNDVSPYLAPRWCSSLVRSMLWIGGCRPSMFIRHLNVIIGKEIEAGLEDYLQEIRHGKLGEVSARQMNMINNLQSNIIKEEDKLSAKLTSLQEDMAAQSIALIANDVSSHREPNRDTYEALDIHAKGALRLFEEAEELRLKTLKEIIKILTPLQAVEFLAASKKLHLCIHAWGGRRDERHGRTEN